MPYPTGPGGGKPADPQLTAIRRLDPNDETGDSLNESTSTHHHSILPARPKGRRCRNVRRVCRSRAGHGPRLGGNDRYNYLEGSARDRNRPSWRHCLQTALQVYSIEFTYLNVLAAGIEANNRGG